MLTCGHFFLLEKKESLCHLRVLEAPLQTHALNIVGAQQQKHNTK